MRSKLDAVTDWPSLSRTSGYRLRELALSLKVSREWISKWLRKKFNKPARLVLNAWRREEAKRLARSGLHGDELAQRLGFSSRGNLWRSLKGVRSKIRKSPLTSRKERHRSSQNENKKRIALMRQENSVCVVTLRD